MMATPDHTQQTHPLPRGPHKLSREEVERSQRDRILWAMAEVSAERGYARVSVADVLSRAGVSRATFYQLFRDKEDCFGAAYEALAELITSTLAGELARLEAQETGARTRHRAIETLDTLLALLLQLLVDAPSLARTFFVEVSAASPEAARRRKAAMDRFVDLITDVVHRDSGSMLPAAQQRFLVELLVGGTSWMITDRIVAGDFEGVLALREPIVQMADQLLTPPPPAR
jgi:AcrR family transcriptional regulator